MNKLLTLMNRYGPVCNVLMVACVLLVLYLDSQTIGGLS